MYHDKEIQRKHAQEITQELLREYGNSRYKVDNYISSTYTTTDKEREQLKRALAKIERQNYDALLRATK